jgi:hypothetical protein
MLYNLVFFRIVPALLVSTVTLLTARTVLFAPQMDVYLALLLFNVTFVKLLSHRAQAHFVSALLDTLMMALMRSAKVI